MKFLKDNLSIILERTFSSNFQIMPSSLMKYNFRTITIFAQNQPINFRRSKKRLLKSAPVRYDIAPKHAVDKVKPKRRKMKNKKDGKRGMQVDKIKKVKKIKNKTKSKTEEDRN